jgi:hypothetical protein
MPYKKLKGKKACFPRRFARRYLCGAPRHLESIAKELFMTNKTDLAKLASAPVARASNSAAKVWKLTDAGINKGASVNGQAGVIIRALAALGGEASSTQIVEMIDRMRGEDEVIETIMAGKADQGTVAIVAHYSSPKTSLRKNGLVE